MIPTILPTDETLDFLALAVVVIAIVLLWLAASYETPEEKQIRKLIESRRAHIKRIDKYLGLEKKGSHNPLAEGGPTHERHKNKPGIVAIIAMLCGLSLAAPHGLHAQQPNCVIAWSAYTQGTYPAVSLQVARSQFSGGPYSIKATLDATATSWADLEIPTFQTNTFYYVIRAVDAYGNYSHWSAETACVTTNEQLSPTANPGGPPSTPPAPSATAH